MTFFISLLLSIKNYLIKKGNKKEKIISYYPRFSNHKELSSHYYRAIWYLPFKPGTLEKIFISKSFFLRQPPERPDYFYKKNFNQTHIEISSNLLSYFKNLLLSEVILTWKEPSDFLKKITQTLKITLLHVETNNKKSIEYGIYPKVLWGYLLDKKEKKLEYEKYKNRFNKLCEELKNKNIENSFVFGNGPSIEDYKKYDYKNSLCIICNSAVQNKNLTDITKPLFITAGDAISHMGVSAYAEKFRTDLFDYIKNHRSYYFSTLELAYFMTLHFPSIEEKFILCPQKSQEPTLNLQETFYLPALSSTLNIHMLPLASTFSQKIYLLGVDGKKEKDEENEDFWPHAKGFQYHNLVESGHLAHPTFHSNRAINEYNRYIKSVETSLIAGEIQKKNTYIPLAESTIPSIQMRRNEFLTKNN
jgi:hypothetical protein